MKKFKYVVLGIATGLTLLPLIDKAFEVAILWLETLKIKPSKKILNHYKDTAMLSDFINPTNNQNDYDDKDILYIYLDKENNEE